MPFSRNPNFVPFYLTFSITQNVKVTCGKLHGFFHHVRKWGLHVWSFMALGDSMCKDWCGLLEMGLSKVTCPIIELYILSNLFYLSTLAWNFSPTWRKWTQIYHNCLKFNSSFLICHEFSNYFARLCYNRFQKVSFQIDQLLSYNQILFIYYVVVNLYTLITCLGNDT